MTVSQTPIIFIRDFVCLNLYKIYIFFKWRFSLFSFSVEDFTTGLVHPSLHLSLLIVLHIFLYMIIKAMCRLGCGSCLGEEIGSYGFPFTHCGQCPVLPVKEVALH